MNRFRKFIPQNIDYNYRIINRSISDNFISMIKLVLKNDDV